jgi:hypothetical protein
MSYFSAFLAALKSKFIEEIKIGDLGAEISSAIAPTQVFTLNLGFFQPRGDGRHRGDLGRHAGHPVF